MKEKAWVICDHYLKMLNDSHVGEKSNTIFQAPDKFQFNSEKFQAERLQLGARMCFLAIRASQKSHHEKRWAACPWGCLRPCCMALVWKVTKEMVVTLRMLVEVTAEITAHPCFLTPKLDEVENVLENWMLPFSYEDLKCFSSKLKQDWYEIMKMTDERYQQ